MDVKHIWLVLFICTTTAFQAQDPVPSYMATVEGHLDNFNPKAALETLESALLTNPQDMTALLMKTDILIEMNKVKDAQEVLNKVFIVDDQYPRAFYERGKLKYQMGQRDSAIHYLDLGLAYDPDSDTKESIYSLKGIVYMSLDKYKQAEEMLYQASRCSEVSLETMKNFATVLYENGKLDEAVMILKETLEIFGNHLETYINTGYLCNMAHQYDEALYFSGKALEIEPDNPYAQANMALSYLRTGDLSKAIQLIDISIRNDNSNSFALRVKGECLLQMREKARACRAFRKAIKMGYTVQHEQTEITKLMVESCE
ncbi:MAG: tetratricopeptide repeat protein [Flavobacteriales bacterium]|nr:tetratricopeptide repeat protein [Flavobacteriales bacterium]